MSPIWMKPISGAKAWRGETLSRDGSWLARAVRPGLATALEHRPSARPQ